MKRLLAFLFLFVCLFSLSISTSANGNKEELGALLNENLDPSLYTHESYSIYQEAVNQGLYVLESAEASQESVDIVVSDLKTAKEGLVFQLNRNILLQYIDKMDFFLHGTEYVLDSVTAEEITTARNEFETLYQSEGLTPEHITQATEKYNEVVQLTESAGKLSSFSTENSPPDVVLPEAQKDNEGLNRIASVRLTIIGIGSVALVLGLAAAILYLKPPKFLK